MNEARKIQLGEQLKAAAASRDKVHVISQEGRWAIYKEGSKRATAIYATRNSAVSNAKKILKPGQIETLVVHKPDGSIFKVQSLSDIAV